MAETTCSRAQRAALRKVPEMPLWRLAQPEHRTGEHFICRRQALEPPAGANDPPVPAPADGRFPLLTPSLPPSQKCVLYWPTEEDTYGPFRIRVQDVKEHPEYTVRQLSIQVPPSGARPGQVTPHFSGTQI